MLYLKQYQIKEVVVKNVVRGSILGTLGLSAILIMSSLPPTGHLAPIQAFGAGMISLVTSASGWDFLLMAIVIFASAWCKPNK